MGPHWPDRVVPTGRRPEWDVGHAFLYHAGNDPIALSAAARAMCLLLGLGTCALAFAWGARTMGAASGLVALAFLAFDPNLLTASTIVYTDVAATFGTLLLLFAARGALATGTATRAAWLGAATGAAAAMKFSTLVLVPLAVAALLAGAWTAPAGRSRRLAGRVAVFAACALGVVWAAYGFTIGPVLHAGASHATLAALAPGRAARAAGVFERVPLPAPDFWRGLATVAAHDQGGHRAFLLGRFSTSGFPLYFPVALAVKTPLPTLGLIALGLLSAIWRRPHRDEALLGVAAALIVGSAILSRIDIGYRHVLPAIPPLVLLGSRAVAREGRERRSRRARGIATAAVALLAWLALDAGGIGAHHHAFFNALAGGPPSGHRVLLDSNIDLGQDLPALARYQRARGVGEVALAYFGEAEPAAYGVRARPVTREEAHAPAPGAFVVSVNELMNLTEPDDPSRFAWLRARRPDAVLGHTLYVYLVGAAARAAARASTEVALP